MCNVIKSNGSKCQIKSAGDYYQRHVPVELITTVQESVAVDIATKEDSPVMAPQLVEVDTDALVTSVKPVTKEALGLVEQCEKWLSENGKGASTFTEYSILNREKTYRHPVHRGFLIRVEFGEDTRRFYWIYNKDVANGFYEFVGIKLKREAHEVITAQQSRFFLDIDIECDDMEMADVIDDVLQCPGEPTDMEVLEKCGKKVFQKYADAIAYSLAEHGYDAEDDSKYKFDYYATLRVRRGKIGIHLVTSIILGHEESKALAAGVKHHLEKDHDYFNTSLETAQILSDSIDFKQYKMRGSLALPLGFKKGSQSVIVKEYDNPLHELWLTREDDDITEYPDFASKYGVATSTPFHEQVVTSEFIKEALPDAASIPDCKAFDLLNLRGRGSNLRPKRISPSHCSVCKRTHDRDDNLILFFNEDEGFATWKCDRAPKGTKSTCFYSRPKERTEEDIADFSANTEKTVAKAVEALQEEKAKEVVTRTRNDILLDYIARSSGISAADLKAAMEDTTHQFGFDWRKRHVKPFNRPLRDSFHKFSNLSDYIHEYEFESQEEAAKLLAMVVDRYFVLMNDTKLRRPNLMDEGNNMKPCVSKTDPFTNVLIKTPRCKVKMIRGDTLMTKYKSFFHRYETSIISFEKLEQNVVDEFNYCVPFTAKCLDGYDESLITPILSFIREVICDNNERLNTQMLTWLAKIVQFPDSKTEMVPILYSPQEGCGKTTFADLLVKIIGIQSIDVSAGSIESLVNERREHLMGKKLCIVNEVRELKQQFGRNVEAFKSLVTDKYMDMRPLYGPKITLANLLEILIATNNLSTLPSGREARRLQLLEVSNKYMQDKIYFKQLYDGSINNPNAINHFYTFLKQLDVCRGPMREIISTNAQREFRTASQDNVVSFWDWFVATEDKKTTTVSRATAYTRYQGWCETEGEVPLRCALFTSNSKGIAYIEEKRSATERSWKIDHELVPKYE